MPEHTPCCAPTRQRLRHYATSIQTSVTRPRVIKGFLENMMRLETGVFHMRVAATMLRIFTLTYYTQG
jgi:hypothetical protein